MKNWKTLQHNCMRLVRPWMKPMLRWVGLSTKCVLYNTFPIAASKRCRNWTNARHNSWERWRDSQAECIRWDHMIFYPHLIGDYHIHSNGTANSSTTVRYHQAKFYPIRVSRSLAIIPYTAGTIANRNTAKERDQVVTEKDSAISQLRYQFESLTDQIKVCWWLCT